MNDVFLRRAHDYRLGLLERSHCLASIAGVDRFLNSPYKTAHSGAAGLVDLGPARDLARCLAGGTGVGHAFSSCSIAV
jgi:hypothetical protein